jgi:uncharacterized membrane protein YjfL (UPF0719 family)
VLILATNIINAEALFTSVMFWSYIAFCTVMVIFFYFNYRLVGKMQGMDKMVKSNLEQQVSELETRLKWHIVGLRIALLFFIVLTEVLPYFQHGRMLDKWHSLSPIVRFGTYAALIVLQFFASRAMFERKFGKHLAYLKEQVKELQ